MDIWVASMFLKKEMATHSSILAWRIPWTEEPGRLQPTGLQRVRHDWATNTISRFITIPIIILIRLNIEIDKLILKCTWKYKQPSRYKGFLFRGKYQTFVLIFFSSSMMLRCGISEGIDIKINWTKEIRPEMSPCIYNQMIFTNSDKAIQRRQKGTLTNGHGTTGYWHEKQCILTIT